MAAGPASMASASSQDAPGGEIEGYELSYQQDFTFLPGFWKNFGVQANYTHLTSELQYIVDPGNTLLTPTTPVRRRSLARAVHRARRTRRTSRCTTRRRSGARALPMPTVGVREPVSDCRRHLRSWRLRCAARERLPGQLATRNIDAKVTWQFNGLPVVLDRGPEHHQPDRRSLGVRGRTAGHAVLEHGTSDLRRLPAEPVIRRSTHEAPAPGSGAGALSFLAPALGPYGALAPHY